MVCILFQEPPAAAPAAGFVQLLEQLGWVDRTALAVLLTFFVIGLFKGLIWQVSRIAILVVAYGVAGRYGTAVGAFLARTPAVGGAKAGAEAVTETPETTLYLAYVLLFLGVLVALSLTAILLRKLANKAGLGFFDRLGGGVLGVATGAAVVLFGLFVVNMFFRGSPLAMAAEASHSLRLSRQAIDWLGANVPDPLRGVLALSPLHSKAVTLPGAPDDRPIEAGAGERVAPPEPVPGAPARPQPADGSIGQPGQLSPGAAGNPAPSGVRQRR